ncbi:NAD(P)/FAD-dependent oxidoreductase [Agromyces soli]
MSISAADRVAVIGGGLAGYTLAEQLRARGHGGPITIVERESAMYDRPPLSKAAFADGATVELLEFAGGPKLEALALDVICDRGAIALTPDAGAVTLDDGTVVEGEVIVFATGGRARRLGFPGNELPGVHVLRTFADARAIRAAAHPGAHILVAGAGLIGAELTSALRQLDVDVTLVDPVETPLVPAVGEAMARRLHAMHSAHGVDVRLGAVAGVDASGSRWLATLTDGTGLEVDAIVVGAGLVPNTELAYAAGIEVNGGIVVDDEYRTSHHRVYAIGDVARKRDRDGVLHRREEHWEAARSDAAELAAILVGIEPDLRSAAWWWSDRYGVHVEGVGRMTGSGRTVFRGEDVAFHLDGGVLVGAVSIDDSTSVRAARRLIDQQVPVAVADLVDLDVPLRELLRRKRSVATAL